MYIKHLLLQLLFYNNDTNDVILGKELEKQSYQQKNAFSWYL